MNVLIPVFPESVPATYIGMMDMLNYAAVFNQRLNPDYKGAPPFVVSLVNLGADKRVVHGPIGIDTHYTLENCPTDTDLIIVPAAVGYMPVLVKQYPQLVGWLKSEAERGVTLSSTCTGTFFIAATGLLDGKEVTTSWFAADDFRVSYPNIALHDEKLIVDNGHNITSGATLSYMNLAIYLIEKYHSKELASFCAKFFLVDKGKDSQLPYSIFNSQKQHHDQDILKAQQMIEQDTQERINITELSSAVAMSERSFLRRFKQATGNTPSEYIQRVKVEQAKALLESQSLSVKEIGFQIGYDDLSHFRQTFKRYTGLTPTDYKARFSFANR